MEYVGACSFVCSHLHLPAGSIRQNVSVGHINQQVTTIILPSVCTDCNISLTRSYILCRLTIAVLPCSSGRLRCFVESVVRITSISSQFNLETNSL